MIHHLGSIKLDTSFFQDADIDYSFFVSFRDCIVFYHFHFGVLSLEMAIASKNMSQNAFSKNVAYIRRWARFGEIERFRWVSSDFFTRVRNWLKIAVIFFFTNLIAEMMDYVGNLKTQFGPIVYFEYVGLPNVVLTEAQDVEVCNFYSDFLQNVIILRSRTFPFP